VLKKKYFQVFFKKIIKIQRLENWPLYQVFSSIFLKAQKNESLKNLRVCHYYAQNLRVIKVNNVNKALISALVLENNDEISKEHKSFLKKRIDFFSAKWPKTWPIFIFFVFASSESLD
jgi:hypothetical protein